MLLSVVGVVGVVVVVVVVVDVVVDVVDDVVVFLSSSIYHFIGEVEAVSN